LAGLRYAMRGALDMHRREPVGQANRRPQPPLYAEHMPAARNMRGCIHCHQAKELRREDLLASGKWKREDIWVYPLPENVGISLEIDRGNIVKSISPGSAAERAGLHKGDILHCLNRYPTHSFADAQYALHKAPWKGEIPVSWSRDGKTMSGVLALKDNWRKTNITWRPSLLELLPSLTMFGPDLTAPEKKALGLPEKQLAFRQDKPVHPETRAMGVRENDVIVGINGERLEMNMRDFLAHIRSNYLVGDRVVLNIIRNGRRAELAVKLR
jgi:S1-C subfamily serine protease